MTIARRTLLCALAAIVLAPAVAHAASPGYKAFQYVTVPDGTELAVTIWYPEGFADDPARKWPSLFEMDGYGGAKSPDDTQFYGRTKQFVVVYASIRGTGCSGGKFDLFSDQSAQDGYDVIEHWMVQQPWSDGRVGITGHSYSGLTGWMVAATHPPHVRGIALSGLIDDFYRGILYPGGVPNSGFPIAWGAVVRPLGEGAANLQSQLSDEHCRANFAQHRETAYTPPPDVTVGAYTETQATEESWAIQHALLRREPGIAAPIQIGQQYQDEQTGPRGGHVLFQHVPADLPKRLVLSNGRHNPNDPTRTKDASLDCWVINHGHDCGDVSDPRLRVLAHFDIAHRELARPARALPTSDWPAPETEWRRYFLRTYARSATPIPAPSAPSPMRPPAPTSARAFNEASMRESTNAGAATQGGSPNEAVWTLPFTRDTALAGPIYLTLWARLTSVDTDFFVDVIDRDTATGTMYYLQRGLLRASLRARRRGALRLGSPPVPTRARSTRPYHPFVNPVDVTPTQPVRYEIEVFPGLPGSRAGHELVLRSTCRPSTTRSRLYAYPPRSRRPASCRSLPGRRHRELYPVAVPADPPGDRAIAADVRAVSARSASPRRPNLAADRPPRCPAALRRRRAAGPAWPPAPGDST